MITFTDSATSTVRSLVDQIDNSCLRLAVAGGSPLAPECDMSLVDEGSLSGEDEVIQADGFTVLIDPESAPTLRGMIVDYVERNGQSGFEVRLPKVGPASGSAPSGPLAERVLAVIEEKINPGVASHGGEIKLVDVKDDVVYIEMSGGCQGCAMSKLTLRQGVDRMIREAVPEIVAIRDVTDHQSGDNPYYT